MVYHFHPDLTCLSHLRMLCRVNDFCLALCSEDILFHMNRHQLYKKGEQKTGRMEGIVSSLLAQQSFFPLRAPKPLNGTA